VPLTRIASSFLHLYTIAIAAGRRRLDPDAARGGRRAVRERLKW